MVAVEAVSLDQWMPAVGGGTPCVVGAVGGINAGPTAGCL